LSGTSADPIRRALWLDALDQRLRPCLPPSLAAHARLANVTGAQATTGAGMAGVKLAGLKLVFLVDSPVWHARLRLATPELLDAARSIGLTFQQSLTEVLLPQAFRGSIAPLGSTMIALVKNTTVAAVIGVPEAANLMATIIENETGSLVVFGLFAIGFVILTLPLGIWFTHLSQRLAVKR